MTSHAVLGASSAHRWMRCTGSPGLIDRLTRRGMIDPGQSSVYADEGSAAHALAADCITAGRPAAEYVHGTVVMKDPVDGWMVVGVSGGIGSIKEPYFPVTEEMAENVQVYLDAIAAEKALLPAAEVLVETRVFPLADAEEEMFGTADVILWCPIEAILVVMDLKFGAGVVVEADHNEQTMYYGLGALRRVAGDAAVEAVCKVRLVITQPRARHVDGPIRVFERTAQELVEWGGVLRSAAAATKRADAPLAAGDWCKFCPAAALCPELRRQMVETIKADFDAPVPVDPAAAVQRMLPDPEDERELGKAMRLVPLVDMWCREVEAIAQRRLEYGRGVDGFKLVRKRANRRWKDPEAVETALRKKRGVKVDDIYDRKLRSPAQLEKVKLIGKGWVAEFSEKPDGGVTVAPVTDPRPAVLLPLLDSFDPPMLLAATAIDGEVTQPAQPATHDSWLESL